MTPLQRRSKMDGFDHIKKIVWQQKHQKSKLKDNQRTRRKYLLYMRDRGLTSHLTSKELCKKDLIENRKRHNLPKR